MKTPSFKIVGHKICPYVQRVVIVANFVGLHYVKEDIDLNNKPAWLFDLNPIGKVPVAIINDEVAIFDSNVICDYINEISNARLLSADAQQRAMQRSWIAHADGILSLMAQLIYRDMMHKDFAKTLDSMHQHLQAADNKLASIKLAQSQQFSIMHAVYATLMRQLFTLETAIGLELSARHPFLASWWQELAELIAVQSAAPENYSVELMNLIAQEPSFLGNMMRKNLT